MKKATKLRNLIANNDILIAPAVYDCISAKVAENSGFKIAFTSGFSLSASLLGKPDLGLLTASEMIERIKHISASVDIPIIADIDTGYGGVLNVMRTVNEVVIAGAGGIILEDQKWPKRCGHFENKSVVPSSNHVQKIRAAIEARGDSELVIVARTDALSVHGLEEAIHRGRLYADAGADIVFIEAPQSKEQMIRIAKELEGIPLFANMIEGGKTPMLSSEELATLGFKVCAFALSGLFSATLGLSDCFRHLALHGNTGKLLDRMSFNDFKKLIELPKYLELQERYKE